MTRKSLLVLLFIISLVVPSLQVFSQTDKEVIQNDQGFTYDHGAVVRGSRHRKEMALAFTADAFGEGGNTVIEVLKKRQIKASFFLTGNFLRSEEFKPLIESIIKEGHYLGPHSDAHLLYCSWEDREKTLVSREEFISDLQKNFAALKDFGIEPENSYIFMPPYEWYNEEIARWAKEANLVLVNPTPGIMTLADYTTPEMKNYLSSDEIIKQVLEYEKTQPDGLNGGILLIHLGSAPERQDKFYNHLDKLLDELQARGYKFVRLDNWLKPIQGKEPQSEKKVSSEEKTAKTQEKREYTPEDFSRKSRQTVGKVEEFFKFSFTPVSEVQLNGRVIFLEIIDDSICCTTEDGKIYILPVEDIRNLKEVQLTKASISMPYSDGRLFWLAVEDVVFGLNKSGQVEVKINNNSRITGRPISDGKQLFLTLGKLIHSYSIEDGALIWKSELEEESVYGMFYSEDCLFVPLNSGRLLVLDKKTGHIMYEYDFKQKISSHLVFDKRNIFIGTDNGLIMNFDARKKRVRWKLKTGSQRLEYFLVRGKDLFAITSGGLMLKLDRRKGHIKMWQTIPGKIFLRPSFFFDELVTPCSDRLLVGFDVKTGQKVSFTYLPFETSAGPCVRDDVLFVSSYSFRDDKSVVHAFRKEPQVRLLTSLDSPQPLGQRINLMVQSAGFDQPRYEFSVRLPDGDERVVQRASRKNTWSWFPAKIGRHELSVRVFDKKNNKKVSIEYNIVSKKEQTNEKEKADEQR